MDTWSSESLLTTQNSSQIILIHSLSTYWYTPNPVPKKTKTKQNFQHIKNPYLMTINPEENTKTAPTQKQ